MFSNSEFKRNDFSTISDYYSTLNKYVYVIILSILTKKRISRIR